MLIEQLSRQKIQELDDPKLWADDLRAVAANDDSGLTKKSVGALFHNLICYAGILKGDDNLDEALEILEDAIDSKIKTPVSVYELATKYASEFGYDERALSIINNGLQTHNSNPQLLLKKIQILHQLERHQTAHMLLRSAHEHHPEHEELAIRHARALLKKAGSQWHTKARTIIEPFLETMRERGIDRAANYHMFAALELATMDSEQLETKSNPLENTLTAHFKSTEERQKILSMAQNFMHATIKRTNGPALTRLLENEYS